MIQVPQKLYNEQSIQDNSESIVAKVNSDIGNHLDIFYDLLSSMIYQTPRELGLEWIRRVAKGEWEILGDETNDSLEVRIAKREHRYHILGSVEEYIQELIRHPSLLQRLFRILVQEILVSDLPVHDQDRMIANELTAPYAEWTNLLAVLSHIELPKDTHTLLVPPKYSFDKDGKIGYDIVFPGHLPLPTDQLDGVDMNHGQFGSQFMAEGKVQIGTRACTHFVISPIVLDRFRSNNNMIISDQESRVRNMILEVLGGPDFYAYKRRGFGLGKKPKEELVMQKDVVWTPG